MDNFPSFSTGHGHRTLSLAWKAKQAGSNEEHNVVSIIAISGSCGWKTGSFASLGMKTPQGLRIISEKHYEAKVAYQHITL
ncbi:hypothetical protein KIN20_024050 [Parelaphostrongylus tenuis]|uniref:Uncharacterized protein n=1 Tax=Parelaphostrongylus tenuis TaxID=148309 RepID=A0AAD5N761_PARTN|nr:hypothetical protein KIN20_024050 [Parelaphostrongylus tenuis]